MEAPSSAKQPDPEQVVEGMLKFAKELFTFILDPKFQTCEPKDRQYLIMKYHPRFSTNYPVVVKYMTQEGIYSEAAFRRFFNKVKADKPKGYEGFVLHQAYYAKFLYIEECKRLKKHWSIKRANEIYQAEYSLMEKMVKKLKEEEASAKNEFSEEKQQNLVVRKQELLDFIAEASASFPSTDDIAEH